MNEIPSIESLIEPYRSDLGKKYDAYRNHVLRQLAFCEQLGGAEITHDTRFAWTIAGAFHDLGIWSDKTWDYLGPSNAIAQRWLSENGREDLQPIVARMVHEHHSLRARGDATDPVEVFRRADVIEVWFGLRRYGLPFRAYRAQLKLHHEAGFHAALVVEFFKNLVRHPLKPAPMFKL